MIKKLVFIALLIPRFALALSEQGGPQALGNVTGTLAVANGGTGAVALSSFTVSGALSGTFTNTVLGPCIAGSTITLTLTASNTKIFVGFNGAIKNDGLTNDMNVGILVDGAFVNGETNAKGITSEDQAVVNEYNNLSFSTLLTGLSAASHNVCLTAAETAGTSTIDSTNSVAKLWMYMLP